MAEGKKYEMWRHLHELNTKHACETANFITRIF